MTDIKLTPTAEVVMELLWARHRLGQTTWTLRSSGMKRGLALLDSHGLIWWKSGVVQDTVMAGLTEVGKAHMSAGAVDPPVTVRMRELEAEVAQLRGSMLSRSMDAHNSRIGSRHTLSGRPGF